MDYVETDWDATRVRVKRLLKDTNLKRAVDREWMTDYVRALLQSWPPRTLKIWVDEVRAYRRDHRFFECV